MCGVQTTAVSAAEAGIINDHQGSDQLCRLPDPAPDPTLAQHSGGSGGSEVKARTLGLSSLRVRGAVSVSQEGVGPKMRTDRRRKVADADLQVKEAVNVRTKHGLRSGVRKELGPTSRADASVPKVVGRRTRK